VASLCCCKFAAHPAPRRSLTPAMRRPTSPVTPSGGCSRVHPCSELRDSCVWPRSVARHRAIGEPLVDRLGVIAHFVVGRQVERPGHLLDVAIPKQRPDVGRERRRLLIHLPLLSLVSRSPRGCLQHGFQAGSIKRLLAAPGSRAERHLDRVYDNALTLLLDAKAPEAAAPRCRRGRHGSSRAR
jgi:hypothetical protein